MDKSKHTKYAFSRAAQNESTAAAEGIQQEGGLRRIANVHL